MSTKLVGLPPARTLITHFVLSLFSGLDILYLYNLFIYIYIYILYIYIYILYKHIAYLVLETMIGQNW